MSLKNMLLQCIGPRTREEARLRRLGRYVPAETPLLGRRIRIIDSASYLGLRNEIMDRRPYDFKAAHDRPLIIDCGANIGLSVIFFKQLYPDSRILALEADTAIAAVLRHNVEVFGYRDVEVRAAAVWTENGTVEFCPEGSLAGRIPKGTGDAPRKVAVPAVRLRDLLEREPVDLLKLDIEGAETAVLRDCRPFVRKDWIRHLFLEYHGHQDEPQTLHELLAMMAEGGYRYHVTSAFARWRPFVDRGTKSGMDLQVNVYAY